MIAAERHTPRTRGPRGVRAAFEAMIRDARLHVLVLSIAGAAFAADDPEVGVGPNPALPKPDKELIPEVEVADAVGWPGDAMPKPAQGWKVEAFARNLDHPRSL